MTPDEFVKSVRQRANLVAGEKDTDVLMYSGDIEERHYEQLARLVMKRKRRKNVLLLLCTYGGDANSAYRMARCLQYHYESFRVMVAGYCKSAGTLLVVGAERIVMLEQAELGPLDVQLRDRTEVGELSSGLMPMQALMSLETRTFESFKTFFHALRFRMRLPTKIAAEIGSGLAVGTYAPVSAQIDPMRVAETERAVKIAWEYGERLAKSSKNAKEGALARLVVAYPSHDFVIDRLEAREIFHYVDDPTQSERRLAELVMARTPFVNQDAEVDILLWFLNDELETQTQTEEPNDGRQAEASDAESVSPDQPDDRGHPEPVPGGNGASHAADAQPPGTNPES